MHYLIEQFKWDIDGTLRYFHLTDSRIFESDKYIPNRYWKKNGYSYTLTRLSDEKPQ